MQLQYLSPVGQIRERRSYIGQMEERLEERMNARLKESRHRLLLAVEKMKGLSPLEKLNQGFSHVADAAGKTLTDVNRVHKGDLLLIHMKNGRITAEVREKEEWTWQKNK